MLVFIGKQAGDHWESWKDNLHYIDYAVIAAIVARRGLAVHALSAAARRRLGRRCLVRLSSPRSPRSD